MQLLKKVCSSRLLMVATGLLFSSCGVFAQVDKITGYWKTIDDKTGEERAVVKIFKATDGKYYGRLDSMLMYADAVCVACKGEDKNKPLRGLLILRGLEPDGAALRGRCMDPESGNTYYGTVTYDAANHRLKLRGSLDKTGILGRTQYWIPADKAATGQGSSAR